MKEDVQRVESHYDRFPYPADQSVSHTVPREFKRGVLNYLLRRREDFLRPDCRIWIAGCGTRQAIHWALSFPEADILATDLSGQALEIASGLAARFKLDNLAFKQHDLMEPIGECGFDFIVSTGVVHHLPDPVAGLANIRSSLRPGGALYLMVYNEMHRQPVAHFRQVLQALGPENSDPDELLDLARRLLEEQLNSPSCAPAGSAALKKLLPRHGQDEAFIADALINPLEHNYNVDGLFELLTQAGLKQVSWMYPGQWRPDAYLSSPELLARFEGLDPVSRWKAVYHLAGRSSPSLELLAETAGTPERPAFTEAELMSMPLLCPRGVRTFPSARGVGEPGMLKPLFEIRDGILCGSGRTGLGIGQKWSLPVEIKSVLEACNGERSMEELISHFANEFEAGDLARLFHHLLPDRLGVLAPVFPP